MESLEQGRMVPNLRNYPLVALIFCFLSFTICSLYSLISNDLFPVIILPVGFILGIIFVYALSRKYSKEQFYYSIWTWVIIVSIYVVIAILVHWDRMNLWEIGLVMPVSGNENYFHKISILFAEEMRAGQFPTYGYIRQQANFVGYPYFLGVIQFLSLTFTKQSTFLGLVIPNCIVGAIIPVIIYMSALRMDLEENVAKLACKLTASFPIIIFFSFVVLRDIIVSFLIALGVYLFIGSLKSLQLKHLLFLSIIIIIMVFFRNLSALAFFAGILTGFCIEKRGIIRAPFIILLLIISASFFYPMLTAKTKNFESWIKNPAGIDSLNYYVSLDQKNAITKADVSSVGVRMYSFPEPLKSASLLVYACLAPIPPSSIRQFGLRVSSILLDLGSIIWYFYAMYLIYGLIKKVHNTPGVKVIFIISLICLIGIALTTVNFRHKTQFLPLLMIPLAITIIRSTSTEKRRLNLMVIILGFFLGTTYLMIKISM